ncbi:unnamed protein product [Vitrella brassicaformis CCMP3155]|uniref:Uncharacterized protein n=1 Tax=Vitrella brassicaformis (strain CCMP3155) TaxID=1169540 RepID=A0A0G4H7K7_VITBC|nr:unnamed protein product [Vitrella brassicaformis CCMP3155]|eukprot:CEM39848.1 unnamed protein product [Vitrella brassicaformis CCMP3155]
MSATAQQILDSSDIVRGPLSRTWGFNVDLISYDEVKDDVLPASWVALRPRVAQLYADGKLRETVARMPIEQTGHLDGLALLKAKSLLYTIAQAYVDEGRRDDGMSELWKQSTHFPPSLEQPMQEISSRLHTLNYCTLADLCLNNTSLQPSLVQQYVGAQAWEIPKDALMLDTPVCSGLMEGEDEETRRIRETTEFHFFCATTDMNLATADLPGLVVDCQKAVASGDVAAVKALLPAMLTSIERMSDAFARITHKVVPPKVWHLSVAKLTVGYGGHFGPSGPQHPTIHLLDAFLGRQNFKSELGSVVHRTRPLLQPNHVDFINAVEGGPQLREFVLSQPKDSELSSLYQDVVDTYINGFLGGHRRKAFAYLQAFSTRNREFSAGTQYDHTQDVPRQMFNQFTESMAERAADLDLAKGARALKAKLQRQGSAFGPKKDKTSPEKSELWLWIEAVLERLPAVLPSASTFAFWSVAADEADALPAPTPPTPSTPHTPPDETPASVATLQCASFKSALSALDIDMPESIQKTITKSMTRSFSRKSSRKPSAARSEALTQMVKRAVTTVGNTPHQLQQLESSLWQQIESSPQAVFKRSITTISANIENVMSDLVKEVCEEEEEEEGEGEGETEQETTTTAANAKEIHLGGCPMLMMMGGVEGSCPVTGRDKGSAAAAAGAGVRVGGCPFLNGQVDK